MTTTEPRRINAYLAEPGQTIRRHGVTLTVRKVRPTDDPHTFRVWCCCGSFSVNTADRVELVERPTQPASTPAPSLPTADDRTRMRADGILCALCLHLGLAHDGDHLVPTW